MNSLREMLAAQDDGALTAIASVGLLRRAHAGLDKDLLCIEESSDGARIEVETHTVELSKEGPAKARCDCPATGMCRHILMAVLHLRATMPVQGLGPTAHEEIANLSFQEIEQFAGNDWPQVLRLATLSKNAVVEDGDRSCIVHLTDAPGPVTFLAKAGLRKAAFKGPDGRRKRFVAAAALIVGKHVLPDHAEVSTAMVSLDVLDQAAQVICSALRHGMVGDPLLAQDMLFDIAVSARVDAAPRLAAQLRSASKQALMLAVHDPEGDPVAFLATLAEAYALVRALIKNPTDPRLTGQLRREYRPAEPRQVAILGIGKWSSPSGARGLTIYCYDGHSFLSSGPARAAGMDPTFSVNRAYKTPFWPGWSPKQMAGLSIFLPAPVISADGVLPERTASEKKQAMVIDGLPFHDNWHSLQADLVSRRGLGLLATGRPLPALIRMADVGKPWFDQIKQLHMIDIRDQVGRNLTVIVPDQELGEQIYTQQVKISGALVEAILDDSGVSYRLVSIMFASPLEVWNVQMEPAPSQFLTAGLLDKIRQKARTYSAVSINEQPHNGVAIVATNSLAAVADNLTFPLDTARRHRLVTQAEELSLSSIAQGLQELRKEEPSTALALAWRLVLVRRAAEEL